jgi:hypothetical protein
MLVPGSRAPDVGRKAYIASVSCGPGDCAAGGAFSDGKLAHAFVVTAQNGTGAGRGPSPAREQGAGGL